MDFCELQNTNVFDTNERKVLEFLAQCLGNISSYSTLNSYRSAISLLDPQDLGNIKIIKRFCKGAAMQKPQAPKYSAIWDPDPVLMFFEKSILMRIYHLKI